MTEANQDESASPDSPALCRRCGDAVPTETSEGAEDPAAGLCEDFRQRPELCRSCAERVAEELETLPFFQDPILVSLNVFGASIAGVVLLVFVVIMLTSPHPADDFVPFVLFALGQVVISLATAKRTEHVPLVWPPWIAIVTSGSWALTPGPWSGGATLGVGVLLGFITLIRAFHEPRYHLCDRRRLALPEP